MLVTGKWSVLVSVAGIVAVEVLGQGVEEFLEGREVGAVLSFLFAEGAELHGSRCLASGSQISWPFDRINLSRTLGFKQCLS